MNRETKFDIEARDGLKRGIDELANAVKVTLGPKGRIVFMKNLYTGIHGTKDGVTVAEGINPEGEHESMGADIIREAATKTAELAGDGTTTATVLAQAMIKHGLRNVAAGANPIDLKRGMELALERITKRLVESSQVIGDSNDRIKQVATISANNDFIIGDLIAEAYAKVGNSGVLTIEESKTSDTYVDVVQGLQFERGYSSPYFATDTDSMQVLYDEINIIITSDKITDISDVNPVLEYSKTTDSPVLLIYDDITTEVLAHMVMQKIRNNTKIVSIKAPEYGVKRKETLQDIAKLTGAYVISKDSGYNLSDFNANMVGSAEKCVITESNTIIVNGNGKQEDINKHLDFLRGTEDKLNSTFEKERLYERIAKLTGGVAVLYVGAASEVEMKEKKDRVDDAKQATKAAIEEGIVPGGGVALLRASEGAYIAYKNFDKSTGDNIVVEACKAPIRQIASNSGMSGDVIMHEIVKNNNAFHGYDFKEDKYVDMLEAGIIDPTKVTRVALENAVSVAGMVIMTECVLINLNEQDEGLPDFLK